MTELLKVQHAALYASNGHYGFAFWLEMGLGKTLLALEEFMILVKRKQATRMLVVCPNSFKGGWLDEIEKHHIDADCHIYNAGEDKRNKEFLRRSFTRPPILIVNYEATRSAASRNPLADYLEHKPSYLVFDESIQLKTHDNLQTKGCIELSQYALYKRILSGKPITQGPHDLWGQLRCIGELNTRNYYSFKHMFCRLGGFKNRQVVGAINEDILAKWIDPHVFRAKKDDWLDLPPKVYSMRTYEMSPAQRSQYKAMEDDFVLWLNDEQNVTIEAAITKYEKLAQIQCGFIIDEEAHTHDLLPIEHNPRILALLETLQTEVSGKVIIVYVHRHAFFLLNAALAAYKPAYIKGGMKADEIEAQKKLFNDDPACRVILLQAIAGRYGHTLLGGSAHSDHCSTTIFFENSYSLDTRSQLEDRNHRLGQKGNSVLYLDLYATSMDKKVVTALQRKQSVFEAIFKHIKSREPCGL
jgi:SNF2 family DNA or RNA helicase